VDAEAAEMLFDPSQWKGQGDSVRNMKANVHNVAKQCSSRLGHATQNSTEWALVPQLYDIVNI